MNCHSLCQHGIVDCVSRMQRIGLLSEGIEHLVALRNRVRVVNGEIVQMLGVPKVLAQCLGVSVCVAKRED